MLVLEKTIAGLACCMLPLAGQNYDKTKWGMSPTEVKKIYPDASWYNQTPNDIRFNSTIANCNMAVSFEFNNDKLSSVTLTPLASPESDEIYKVKMQIIDALELKYGSPSIRNRPVQGIETIKWYTSETQITADIVQKNTTIVFLVKYVPRNSVKGL